MGAALELPGAPWWYTAVPALVLDMPFVLLALVLAVKVWRRRHCATRVAFWLYAIDTLVFALGVAASITIFHSPIHPFPWRDLTLIVIHTLGLLILSRAHRAFVSTQKPAKLVATGDFTH